MVSARMPTISYIGFCDFTKTTSDVFGSSGFILLDILNFTRFKYTCQCYIIDKKTYFDYSNIA